VGKVKKFGIGVLIVIGGFIALATAASLTTTDEDRARWEAEREQEKQPVQSLSKDDTKNPQTAKEWYDKGIALHKQGNYPEAINAFDQAIKFDSDHANAWTMKGNAIGRLGNYAEAINAFDQAIKINPNHENAWYNKGYTLSQLGNYAKAINAFDEVLKINPYSEEANIERDRAIKLSYTTDNSQSNSNIKFDPIVVEAAKKNIPGMQELPREVLKQCKSIKSLSDYQTFLIAFGIMGDDLTDTIHGINTALTFLELEGYDKHPEVGPLISQTRNLASETSNCIDDILSRYGS